MTRELFPNSPNKGEQARRGLLLAALEKFGQRGYDNASVREIADAAGQNVGAIAYYFGNKESLYAEVLKGIGGYLRSILGEYANELRGQLASGNLDPDGARTALKRIFRTMLGEQIDGDFYKVRSVMMREQASPSESFDLLYRETIRPLHELLTRILAVVTGEDPQSPMAIVRAHALFGQVIVFTLARETIRHRLEVPKLGPEHAAMIGDVIDEHIDSICRGFTLPQP
ncbi:MAG: CerR family C-terminal domain-containing protein [Verrucomicrobiae bacterium]|nr:CerR family C-terminal domain-containing protein [Verrucomicrobiae bacterium]